jgi:hydroxymethylpyrimidine pyrophosphatase-like HAD family hydrolase
MAPLSFWPLHGTNGSRKDMVGVFRNIDHTLTTEGSITPDALQALQNLKDAGRIVIPITGRPVGWSIPFASTWPVDAIVTENGA